jgi:hypothetical protein
MSREPAKSEMDIIDMIKFITQRVNDLSETERKEIYRIIYNSDIDSNKIQEKGGGIQIKFRDIPQTAIVSVYQYMKKRISEKEDRLKNCTEENEETVADDDGDVQE